jgi:hypothetical protein
VGNGLLLVDGDVVDCKNVVSASAVLTSQGVQRTEPVGVLEGMGMLGDVFVACCSFGSTGRIVRPRWTCPISAERGVEDDLVVEEVRGDVAASLEVVGGFLS